VVQEEIPADMLESAKSWRAKMIEKIVAEDETLLDKYLGGEEIAMEDLRRVLRQATINYKLVPVFFGSSLKISGCN